jgi:hypothetical protein
MDASEDSEMEEKVLNEGLIRLNYAILEKDNNLINN